MVRQHPCADPYLSLASTAMLTQFRDLNGVSILCTGEERIPLVLYLLCTGWDQTPKAVKIYITGISDLSQASKDDVKAKFKAK